MTRAQALAVTALFLMLVAVMHPRNDPGQFLSGALAWACLAAMWVNRRPKD